MNGMQRGYLVVGLIVGALAGPCSSHAQYTADYQINVISGVTSNWIDALSNTNAGYVVGSNCVNDVLLIDSGGVLSNGNAYVGYAAGANNNTAIVSDSGSAWSNSGAVYVGYSGSGNELVVANGGVLQTHGSQYRGAEIGYDPSSSNNTVLVTGTGSTWIGSGFDVGYSGSGNRLLITDGGQVLGTYNPYVAIGWNAGSSNNLLQINGPGSLLKMNDLVVGTAGSYNTLVISSGGAAYGQYGEVGGALNDIGGSNNLAIITGPGSIWSNSTVTVVGDGGGGNKMIISAGGTVYDPAGAVDWYSSNNTVVVTDHGSLWMNTATLTVGAGGLYNQLIVSNGGAVYAGAATYIGSGGGSNAVLATGAGSVLSCTKDLYIGFGQAGGSNQLVVADGALVYDANGHLGTSGNSGNLALVTGASSVWSNSAMLEIGHSNSIFTLPNMLVVTNGGTVYDYTASVGGVGSQVLVGGNGATWRSQGDLYVGKSPSPNGGSSAITIGTGGTVIAGNLYVVEPEHFNFTNTITVSGGTLIVTNGSGTAMCNIGMQPMGSATSARLTINSGTVTADNLVTTPLTGNILFNGGVLSTKASTIYAYPSPNFAVGNGTNAAVFNLAPGGTGFHFFAAGLAISSNAALTGIGTVVGTTTISLGGMLAPGDGPGSIIFSNSLTLAAGSTLAVTLNGTGAGQYSQIIGLGGLSVSNAVLNISLGYVPLPGDSFTIISNLTSSAILGTFVTTDGLALPNSADFTVDNTIFQIDYAANADGLDVTLTAQVPEPSSLLLTALGAITLWTFVKRKRVYDGRASRFLAESPKTHYQEFSIRHQAGHW